MNYPDLEPLRNIKITDILGVQVRGRINKIKCPFHADKTPSFVIYPDNSYHCFGCGKHGAGAISFLLETGEPFHEVIKELERYL